eukprot:2145103-Pleurochrysis_carterae.AAC.1
MCLRFPEAYILNRGVITIPYHFGNRYAAQRFSFSAAPPFALCVLSSSALPLVPCAAPIG